MVGAAECDNADGDGSLEKKRLFYSSRVNVLDWLKSTKGAETPVAPRGLIGKSVPFSA